MNDKERASTRGIDHFILEARAAHVYLDVAQSMSDPAQRQRNIASAQSVMASLEGYLASAAVDDAIRERVQKLSDVLRERLSGRTDAD